MEMECEIESSGLFAFLSLPKDPERKVLNWLVGGFNPSEKYARQIGSFPRIGMNTKNI